MLSSFQSGLFGRFNLNQEEVYVLEVSQLQALSPTEEKSPQGDPGLKKAYGAK